MRRKRKHQFATGWPTGFCIHCRRKTGLEMHQLRDMPVSMAVCHGKDAPKIGWFERITNAIDCTIDRSEIIIERMSKS